MKVNTGDRYGHLEVVRRCGQHIICNCDCGRKEFLVPSKTIRHNVYGCNNHLPQEKYIYPGEARIMAWSVLSSKITSSDFLNEFKAKVVNPYLRQVSKNPTATLLGSLSSSNMLCYKVSYFVKGEKAPPITKQKWIYSPLPQIGRRITLYEEIHGSTPTELMLEAKKLSDHYRKQYFDRKIPRARKIFFKHGVCYEKNRWYAVVLIVLR